MLDTEQLLLWLRQAATGGVVAMIPPATFQTPPVPPVLCADATLALLAPEHRSGVPPSTVVPGSSIRRVGWPPATCPVLVIRAASRMSGASFPGAPGLPPTTFGTLAAGAPWGVASRVTQEG